MVDTPASPLVALTRAEIAAAEARCAKASKGPWEAAGDNSPGESSIWAADGFTVASTLIFTNSERHPALRIPRHTGQWNDDARFIAEARTDLPRALVGNAAYLALVERIEQRKEQLKQQRSAAYSQSQHDLVEAFSALLNELRALLSPPKEPTR